MRVEKKGKKEKEPILFVGSGPDTFGKKYHLVHGLNISIGRFFNSSHYIRQKTS
jgi:hypothetical protein